MKKLIIIITILSALCHGNLFGIKSNDINIKGKISLHTGEAAVGALITILTTADSSITKDQITDENGLYSFEALKPGAYTLKISYVGYEPYQQNIEVKGDTDIPEIRLKEAANSLGEVQITHTKPLVERKFDKLIVNVENSILAAGNSAWDILGKSPGVQTDQNDNVKLKGKQGVIILIDGKRTALAGSDLANMLKAMPAGSIEKIEIVTNPSARYDAAGNAGIIDIRLVKDKRMGTNGTISLAYGQGRFPKTNNGVSFNHRNKSFNLYGNYNLAYREGFSSLILYRKFYENGTFQGAYSQDNYLRMDYLNNGGRLGLDYFISPKTTVGVLANINNLKFNPQGNNLSYVIDENEQYNSKFTTANKSNDHWWDWGTNLNFKHVIDTLGQEIKIDMDYADYANQTYQNFTTQTYTLYDQLIGSPYLLYGDIKGGLKIYSFKSDYTRPLNPFTTFEAGIKSSLVKSDNNLQFFDRSNEGNVFDTSKSNHFLYSENINAAYVNASRQKDKWTLQAGLRMEHTNAKGNQLVNNTTFHNQYINFFPSAMAAYTINNRHEISLSASRRLDRPSYNQLNPFKFFLDPTTYKEGNPYLNPQYSWNLEFSHTFNQKIITTLGYSHTTGNITNVLIPSETNERITIQTDKNLAVFDYYGLSVYVPFKVASWWQNATSGQLYYGVYKGDLVNTTLNKGALNANINTQNTFYLPMNFSLELSADYRTRELYGYMDVKPTGYVSIGAQKQFWNKKATIKFTVNDIFYTANSRALSIFNTYVESFKVTRDTRVAVLSISYRFGNNGVAPNMRRKSGAEEERRRAAGGNQS